jgi:hypothetical protein
MTDATFADLFRALVVLASFFLGVVFGRGRS